VYNIVNSVQLPLCNMAFTSPLIMTAALATKMQPSMWVAVAVVLVGFVIYQFVPMEKVNKEQETGEEHGEPKLKLDAASPTNDRPQSTAEPESSPELSRSPQSQDAELISPATARSDELAALS
jgi:hypothetical protein